MTRWNSLPSRRRRVIRQQVFAVYGRACWLVLPGCTGWAVEVDHRTPDSAGGTHDLDNLRPACRHCNAARQARPLPAQPVTPLPPSRDW